MPAPPIPQDEARRLEALRLLAILDTPSEERFDRMTRLAVRFFDVPYAAISIIDKDRQWFKSEQGLGVKETPRDISFCGHAILCDSPLVVPDASRDPKFKDNPLVTGKLGIRFYAGVPLRAPDGLRVGMFCIMDRRPRRFPAGDLASLQDLAFIAQDELSDVRLNKAYAALSEREAELEDFIENAGDLILRSSAENRILYANRAFKETLGWSDEELKDKAVADLLLPSERPRCREQFERVRRGETVKDFETALTAKDGREVPVSGTVNFLMKDGKPFSTRMILRDITARKQVERFRSEFFHQVNHELRNPLTLIIGGLRILVDNKEKLPQELRKWVEMIDRNSTHLLRMIEDLLELTRSETGKLAVSPQAVDIGGLACQLAADYQARAGARSISLTAKAAAGLPPALADPLRYRQILGNLLDNALKFTPEGGKVAVEVSRSGDGTLETSVSDTGLGISEKDIPNLFEHLFQASANFELRRKGLGLGLYICKTLVTRQNGRIWVESAPGKGSAFRFTLPVSSQAAAAPADPRGS
ncbi:MAG: ATP-binding protein [Elusimicrobiota bacterium]|jgi:PAS domain S-box-containing protein